jgi:putative transcriptional regulator
MSRKKDVIARTLLRGAREAAEIARGARAPARVTRQLRTAATVLVREPPTYDARRVRRVREQLNMSQAVFAQSLNASDATVRAWEQGKRFPDGPSRRLLELAEKQPAVFETVVGLGTERARAQA